VHGEMRHLTEHSKLAGSGQVKETVIKETGGMIRIAPGPAAVIEQVPSGRLALEGGRVVPLDGELVRGRARALWNGSATITMVIDKVGNVQGDPILTTSGLLDTGDFEYEDDVLDAAEDAVERLSKKDLRKDDLVAEAVRMAVRRYFRNTFNKNAVTSVHLVRV